VGVQGLIYVVFAAICTLVSARLFFDARQSALNCSEAARRALTESDPARQIANVTWSAPLDDVFIHFDFARSLAHGHFFEWAPGGGYSSGATSWLYPAILGAAYRLGFTGFALGRFSDWFATICVFTGLVALRHALAKKARWIHYLMAATVCFQGLLGFALWSGMEFALFFALWCCGQALFQNLAQREADEARHGLAWLLGLLGLLLTATRPESICCLGAWFIFAGRPASKGFGTWARLGARLLGPACLYVLVRAMVNRWLTGDFADAGSLAKLDFLAPHNNAFDALRLWVGNMGFQIGRITAYHTGVNAVLGSLLWVLVLLSLILRGSRTEARVLFTTAVAWMCLVASNEYVRYQNDRYTMAPLLWLLLCAALAVRELVEMTVKNASGTPRALARYSPALFGVLACFAYWYNQAPRLSEQAWLFGRASKNIAEQQLRMGLLLGADSESSTHRLLLGDAGAIEYFSWLPGVDAFGLGGTARLPFARAVRSGNGATLELIERMQPQDRPDLMALYPSWWKDLPLWFGRPILEVDITGNVMCGASNKVLYVANWRGFDSDPSPAVPVGSWHVVDELDIADLVSERAHDYSVSRRHSGYVFMKLLPDPRNASRDLFDAGRILFDGDTSRFRLTHFTPNRPLRLVARAAPHAPMSCRVLLNGAERGRFTFVPTDGWVESALEMGPSPDGSSAELKIQAQQGECNLFHIWALQPDR
jgi:hypothetical protein